jgi:Ca2+-binding EF-hand superfamily protein
VERKWKVCAVAMLAAVAASGDLAAAPQSGRSGGAGGTPAERLEQRMARADRLFGSFDANQDGIVEPNEMHGRERYVYERMAKEAGLDPSHSISAGEFRDAVRKQMQKQEESGLGGRDPGSRRFGKRGSGDPTRGPEGPGGPPDGDRRRRRGEGREPSQSPGGDPSPRGPAAESSPVPKSSGFGLPTEQPKVAGFGQPASGAAPSSGGTQGSVTGSSSTGSSPAGPAREGGFDDRIRKYAEALLKQYDENKNGVLEKSEWSKMRGSPEKHDRNNDSVVTLDELTHGLSEYSRSGTSSGGGSSYNSSTSSSSSSPASAGYSATPRSPSGTPRSGDRKSYRFLSATERLPKGLPDWFARKDADGDGQVSMAEYSSDWDDAKVAEFSKYDLNDDGVVTPEEVLQADKAKPASP